MRPIVAITLDREQDTVLTLLNHNRLRSAGDIGERTLCFKHVRRTDAWLATG